MKITQEQARELLKAHLHMVHLQIEALAQRCGADQHFPGIWTQSGTARHWRVTQGAASELCAVAMWLDRWLSGATFEAGTGTADEAVRLARADQRFRAQLRQITSRGALAVAKRMEDQQ